MRSYKNNGVRTPNVGPGHMEEAFKSTEQEYPNSKDHINISKERRKQTYLLSNVFVVIGGILAVALVVLLVLYIIGVFR